MGGDFLYFLHRHFRLVFISGLIAAGGGVVLLLAAAAHLGRAAPLF